MRSFPCFVALSWALLCRGTEGFAKNVANARQPFDPSQAASFSHRATRVPPLVTQVSSLAYVEPMPKPSVSSNLKNAGRKYLSLSEEKPIVTKGVSAAVVGGMGDVLSQILTASATGSRFIWDPLRTLSFMMMGLCFKGPVLHFWYGMLGRIANWTKVRRGFGETKSTLTAVTLDQTIGVALIYPLNYLVFEVVSSVLSLRPPSLLAVQAKMAASLIPVILAQYYVWPLAQLLSFKYCPPSLRVLYADAISIFWNCFMCAKMAG